jgi:hypothetical protein
VGWGGGGRAEQAGAGGPCGASVQARVCGCGEHAPCNRAVAVSMRRATAATAQAQARVGPRQAARQTDGGRVAAWISQIQAPARVYLASSRSLEYVIEDK